MSEVLSLIDIKNLYFTYNPGKSNEYRALVNIELKVFQDEFVIIFGPSGCGKSTLLNIIAGLEKPDEGDIKVMGMDIARLSKANFASYHRKKIGMIYQSYNLIHSLTVTENIALPQLFIDVPKKERDKKSDYLMDKFGIKKHANKIPTELSGGEQQRIGIARAIINDPEIILADEPVGNLDSVSAENVLGILDDLNKKDQKTIIMVTHNPEYLNFGDRIIYMKDGVITREVKNKGNKHFPKLTNTPKSPVTKMQEVMRTYNGLSPEQINILIMPYKSKIFAHHFITDRTLDETSTFEEVVQRRLLGTISENEMLEILDRPHYEGGIGYDIRTARKLVRRMNRIIRIAYFIQKKYHQKKNSNGYHIRVSKQEKAEKVVEYLLKTCYLDHYKNLSNEQIKRLELATTDRISGNLQKLEYYNVLDASFKKSGVGLNSVTAKNISEELELILIVGFGVSQRGKTRAEQNEVNRKQELRNKVMQSINSKTN